MKKLPGFTLVELLISMGIMAILLTILAQVFSSILSMRTKVEAVSALAQDSRYLVLRLSYDVGRATSITSPSVGNTLDSLTLVIAGENYTYSLVDGNLDLSVGGGSPQRLNSSGTSLSSLSFTRSTSIGGKSIVQLDTTLAPTTIQSGIQNNPRTINTTFVTR